MKRALVIALLAVAAFGACGGHDLPPAPIAPVPAPAPRDLSARLPRAPGPFAPSLLAVVDDDHGVLAGAGSTGAMLSDVDSCASCHPDAAAQWSSSAHSFASFGNPIYRTNVELVRTRMGKAASNHCAGCHDVPLLVDGLMAGEVPPADLRGHSGVTCRLCHGVKAVTPDGNGSYTWSGAAIDAPVVSDPASVARHKAQAQVKTLGSELCVSCHRGFLSPDMGAQMPVHIAGLEEPGAWRNSAWTGNGMARVDDVKPATCIDCHMERETASPGELGAEHGTFASHRFLGGQTWMAAMRGDTDHLKRLQAKLVGAASINIEPAPIAVASPRVAVDVVIRNLLVGHRFPGGVMDIQDTWVEVEVADHQRRRLAASGLAHERDARDTEAHVLRTLAVDGDGDVLAQHELAGFRGQIATQTIAPRDAEVVRYAFDVPASAELPLTVTARLRHRSRGLAMQATVCAASQTALGRAFIAGARGARDVELDPCRPQPITEIAQTTVELGAPATDWKRMYEHGMALTAIVTERLDEARTVLEAALAAAPTGADPHSAPGFAGAARSGGAGPFAGNRPRAMILVQLAVVADRQGRADDAIALLAGARVLLPPPGPAALDEIAADAYARVWRWQEAEAPAAVAAAKAPRNTGAWILLARIRGSLGDDAGALVAATTGLALTPRDADLLRTQATALAALSRPEAKAALAAYERFRAPDDAGALRMKCAATSPQCAREREQGHTHELH